MFQYGFPVVDQAGSLLANQDNMSAMEIYNVVRVDDPLEIDGNWDKAMWQNVEVISINQFLWTVPGFRPFTQAKMIYDDEFLFAIFRVQDRYVRCMVQEYNGPVYTDSCVELFFSPDVRLPERYFNLEVNCGGIPLMYYNIIPRVDRIVLDVEDIKKIEIAHSLPRKVFSEIVEDITWTIEYKIPFSMLEKYSEITRPQKGVIWRVNLFKIAQEGSNPHYASWSKIDSEVRDFHVPDFFGKFKFH